MSPSMRIDRKYWQAERYLNIKIMFSKLEPNNWPGIILFMFLLTACTKGSSEEVSNIRLIQDDSAQKVDVMVGGTLLTSYLYADTLKKPVLYPITSASGNDITRGYPIDPRVGDRVDHPHHVGLWFNYGDVNGLDYWNNSDNVSADNQSHYGSIRHQQINRISSGDDQGELEVTMDWVNSEGEPLLRENTTFIFRGENNTRMIDRNTTLTALDEDVSLKDNKEGLLGIRVARQLEHPSDEEPEVYIGNSSSVNAAEAVTINGRYNSSEGVAGEDVWGTRAKWMNLSGQVNDEQIAVAILDHQGNPGYPTYWHARGYGLFAANPLAQEIMSDGQEVMNMNIKAGESVTFKHRVLVMSGDEVSDEQLNDYWKDFNNGK